jgi:hypothetical protein
MMHKSFSLVLGILLFLSAGVSHSAIESGMWHVTKGKHFVVHTQLDDPYLSRDVLHAAEAYYDRVASRLGYFNRDSWTWEKRCSIYLFRDKQSYLAGTGLPAWSNAATRYEPEKVIQAYVGYPTFLTVELPHEIAHLVFREYVGPDNGEVPLWLDEGVALLHEEGSRTSLLETFMRKKLASGEWIRLTDLLKVSEGTELASWKSQGPSVSLFYAEAYSLVKFLVSSYGERRFVEFLRRLKQEESLEEALEGTYGRPFRDLSHLEREWQRSLDIQRSA